MSKKKRLCWLFLNLILISGAIDSLAGEKQGAEVVVRMINGQESRGELIAVKEETLLLKEEKTGGDLSLKIDEINSVKVVNRPQTLKWTLLGAVACGIAFPAAKYYMFAKEEAYTAGDWFSRAATESLGLAAVIGVAFGTVVGAGIGMSKGKDDVFPLAESPLMRVVYLQRLRFLARVSRPV
jgi:hypothetical protein